MASPAVFCLRLQLRPSGSATSEQNSESNQSSRSSESKPTTFSINSNGAIVRSLNNNLNESRTSGGSSSAGSIILLRGTRISDNGHILVKDENRVGCTTVIKTIDESDEMGQILVQQNDLSEGVVLQSVKRLGGNGGPVLLYTSGSDTLNGNGGHILIQTTAGGDEFHSVCDGGQRPMLLHAVETVTTKEETPVSTPLGSDGEPIKLPENLESLPRADHFPTQRHRWNTNEEIAAILISFDRHTEWQSKEVKIRPKSGSMLLYSRKKVRYRRDGYCWKKRKDGKTTREDHMKLKVQGTECIYGCYVHSAILPTFHRRCYWLLQNPDIVLVHYLNVPYPDDNKLAVITPSLALWADKKEWTKDELVSQLKPMFFSEDEPDLNNELEISTAETVEAIVSQLMEKQRQARQAALVKQLECGCPDSTCADGKTCSHPMRRITAAKSELASSQLPSSSSNSRSSNADNNNQVSSTTGSGGMLLSSSPSPRVYSRESRNHHGQSGGSSSSANTPPLVLSLSQIQGSGGLLILNSNASTSTNSSTHQSIVSPVSVTSFVCSTNTRSHRNNDRSHKSGTVVLKQEAMDTNPSSCCQQQTESITTARIVGERTIKMDVSNTRNSRSLFGESPFGNKSHDMSNQQSDMMSIPSAPSTPSKQMDTSNEEVVDFKHQNFCEDTVVLLGTDSSGSLVSKSDGSSVINGGFFNETLDLSQEDIQRTLSANMPLCSSELEQHDSVVNDRNSVIANKQVQANTDMVQDDVIVSEVNPMDFINSCDVVVSPTHVVDDDVFVNLDAFDMLGEFPELEVLEGSHGNSLLDVSTSVGTRNEKSANIHVHVNHEHMEGTAKISDYSPEWAYPEGGVKVLVTGPWHSSAPYTVLFDTFPVPTTLVQSGVLRCFCPAHEAGLATLQVACDGYVISNSVIFEYKLPPREERTPAPEPKVERSNDNLLKFTLLQRLEAMDDRLQIKQEPADGPDCVEDSSLFQQSNFEDRLVIYCQAMTSRLWHAGEELSVSWFASHRGMTLLHLAASLGYSKLVCAMLHWRAENSSLLLETEVDALSQDEDGFTPLMWACARGHTETAVMLYRWNHTALNIRNALQQTALECARANSHNDLAKEVEKLESRREKANMLLLHTSSSSSSESATLSPVGISPASSVVSLSSVVSTSKSHDGVFLRPGAVTRSESQKYKSLNLDFESTIPSSSESNITRIGTVTTQSPQSSEMTTITRPGSQPYQRLVKRPSVDSGIHMTSGQSSDSLPSLRNRFTKGSGREIPKLSRFDRSMSLPLNSPQSNLDNSFDSGTADITPTRKMDFALCEVGTGPRSNSPLIDVEALSDDEESDNRQSTVGEQEVRVLTLAEQIIAAMPDRIKNESEEMLLDANSPGPLDSMQPGDTLSDVFMEPLLDHSNSSFEPAEFNFEFSDHNYRYYDVGTPCSSLSPASSSCLQSPCSFTLDSPSPPPTTADFCEFFQASGSLFEKDFTNLTLSDQEQRELYEAAKIIQKAYRSYKGRQKLEEQDKERAAAVLIQNYYRRYKQYAYFKQMTHAAMVIQSGFRSYCEHKRFKKSQEAAVCIQNYYRNYKEQGGRGSREGTPAAGLKRTYSQRRQHQAARKIQQFMRQSKNKLQRERAEKEKQLVRSQDVPQRSLYQGGNSISTDPNNSNPRRPLQH